MRTNSIFTLPIPGTIPYNPLRVPRRSSIQKVPLLAENTQEPSLEDLPRKIGSALDPKIPFKKLKEDRNFLFSINKRRVKMGSMTGLEPLIDSTIDQSHLDPQIWGPLTLEMKQSQTVELVRDKCFFSPPRRAQVNIQLRMLIKHRKPASFPLAPLQGSLRR